MKKIKNIIIAICIVAVFATCIYYVCSYYTTKDTLLNTQYELSATNVVLEAEAKKVSDLSDSLNSTQLELETANEIIASRDGDVYFVNCEVTNKEIEILAKAVWGEARGCNKMEQSAVIWCILNRVDAGYGSIARVITAPNQFTGYHSGNPVNKEIKALVEDVIARWKIEKITAGDVGRTLPKDYLYFYGRDGKNHFRNKYKGDYKIWDWDCWNPYK